MQQIPGTLHRILVSFHGAFSRPSFDNFVALLRGWILCPGRHTVSRVIQAAGPAAAGTKHFSTLYRFLGRARWQPDLLGKTLFRLLLPFLPEEITALVDDTLCHRRGPHFFGAGMHHDAARSTYGWLNSSGRKTFFTFGHQWVVLSVWLPLPWSAKRGVAVPILFRLYRGRRRCPESAYRKRTELASELLDLLARWIPPQHRLTVAGDTEYACRTVVRRLPDGVDFVGPLARNAALYEPAEAYRGVGRPRRRGRRLPGPQERARRRKKSWKKTRLPLYGRKVVLLTQTQVCLWYRVADTRRVRIVLTRDPSGRMEDRAYFCTNPKASVHQILTLYARRWSLELSFRDAKQWMGLEDPQNGWGKKKRVSGRKKKPGPQPRGRKGEGAVRHTFPLAFMAFGVVVVWYLRHGQPEREVSAVRKHAPWYRHKRAPSFADMLVALRSEMWLARVSAIPGERRVRRNLRELLQPALLAA